VTSNQKLDHPGRWLGALMNARLGVLEGVLRGLERHGLAPRRVHKLRVAARRLRNALQLARVWRGGGRLGRLSKKLGRFATEFGALRDLDVQAEFLGRATDRLEPGMQPPLRRLRRRYADERRRLAKTLSGRLAAGGKLAGKIRKAAAKLETTDAGTATTDAWRARLAGPVHALTDACQAAANSARAAPDDAALHRWRIAAKKLRYRLEALDSLYGGGLGVWIERLTQLQDALGEAHDAAVFQETFRTIAAAMEAEGGGGTAGRHQFQAAVRRVLTLNQARKRRALRQASQLRQLGTPF
jgi:CHAD domain-containing protein